jgi:hypothetical protein
MILNNKSPAYMWCQISYAGTHSNMAALHRIPFSVGGKSSSMLWCGGMSGSCRFGAGRWLSGPLNAKMRTLKCRVGRSGEVMLYCLISAAADKDKILSSNIGIAQLMGKII